jgi:hypothetical protein
MLGAAEKFRERGSSPLAKGTTSLRGDELRAIQSNMATKSEVNQKEADSEVSRYTSE